MRDFKDLQDLWTGADDGVRIGLMRESVALMIGFLATQFTEMIERKFPDSAWYEILLDQLARVHPDTTPAIMERATMLMLANKKTMWENENAVAVIIDWVGLAEADLRSERATVRRQVAKREDENFYASISDEERQANLAKCRTLRLSLGSGGGSGSGSVGNLIDAQPEAEKERRKRKLLGDGSGE